MSEEMYLEHGTTRSSRSWRGISFVVIISLSIMSILSLGNTGAETTKPNVQSAAIGNRISAIPDNTMPNPPSTVGPLCKKQVIFLLDRSHSVMSGSTDYTKVNALKLALDMTIIQMGTSAQAAGRDAYVYISAFAARAKDQNPYGGSSLGEFYAWIASNNVAVPASRDNMVYNVIGSNDNGIYYRDSSSGADYKTIIGDPVATFVNAIKGYHGDDNGSTNYQAAFESAMGKIDFGTDPTSTGDDDFDMVIMLTDGLPTSHNGNLAGPWVTPDNGDLLAAQSAVNNLRTGGFVRPPVPVYGIITGSEAAQPGVASYMRQVFGTGNFAMQENWGLVYNEINAILSTMGCAVPKTNVTSGISATAAASPSTVMEGQNSNVTVTVTNTGSVDLTNVTVTGPGGWTQVIPTLPAGTTSNFPAYLLNVPLGGSNPMPLSFNVTSTSMFNSATMNLVGGTLNPTAVATTAINVERIPLPS